MKRSILAIAGMAIAFWAGCGTQQPPPPADVEDEAPNDLKEGTYFGSRTCTTIITLDGSTEVSTDTEPFSAVIDAEGAGEEYRVGYVLTSYSARVTRTITVTRLTILADGLYTEAVIRDEWFCQNRCTWAWNGVCDEPDFCAIGDDCGDCGQLIMTGLHTIELHADGYGGIDYVSHSRITDPLGDFVTIVDCAGNLAK